MQQITQKVNQLKPYPKYKESGTEWLGKVPEKWEIKNLGHILVERKETNKDGEITEILSVTKNRGVILYSEKGNIGNKHSDDTTRYKIVYPDDIVVNCMNVIIGSVGISKYTGCLSPVYYVLKPRNNKDDPAYLNAYFQTKPFQESLVRIGNGIMSHRMRIPMEKLKLEPFPVPPSNDQKLIVRYLNYINHRILKYIAAKKKLIKLLEEQKQAIIHQAVTGALDVRIGKPYAKYKASGIEWLGDVPEYWEVLPLKRVFISMDYGISESASDNGKIPLLTMGNIQNGNVSIPQNGGVNAVDSKLLLNEGDLLFNRTNSADLVAKVGLFTGPSLKVTFASYLVRLRLKSNYSSRYLNYLLNSSSIIQVARRESIPSLHQSNLNPTRYGRLHISIPDLELQNEIVRYIDEKVKAIDKMVESTQAEIRYFIEYRTRLNSDVVTGKFDVREIAKNLPDDIEPIIDEVEGDDVEEVSSEGFDVSDTDESENL